MGRLVAPPSREQFDARVLVEVTHDQLAIVLLEFQAVEPKLVVLAVGVPRAGFGLFGAHDDALDGCGGERGVAIAQVGDLLRDADALADLEGCVEGHGRS